MVRTSRLVGRARELEVLVEALEQAKQGSPALVLLGGEPGIGKTRLLDELAARAESTGARVAWGRTWEIGAAPAFWPWLEVLRVLPGDAAKSAAEVLAGAGTADPAARFAVFDGVASVLRELSTERPLLLLFDDLHAADPSSLQLVELVARQRLPGLVLAATFRDREAGDRPEVDATLSRLARLGELLSLGPLERGDVAELARSLGNTDASALARVYEASDGNPLFVVELLASNARGEVPRGVRAALADRMRRIPDAARRALGAVAIIGREADVLLLADVLRDPPDEVASVLGEAVQAGLVTEQGNGRFRFSHALIAETLSAASPHRSAPSCTCALPRP